MTRVLQPNFSHPIFAKYSVLVSGLETAESPNRLDTLKAIKNAVIGNTTKKLLFMHLGVIPKCVDILMDKSTTTDQNVKTQAAIVLGSFAYGNDQSIENLVHAGAITPLLDCLLSNDLKLVEASARALKIMLQNPTVPRDEVLKDVYLTKLVQLLSIKDSSNLCELAGSIIARCCEQREQQMALERRGAINPVIEILLNSENPKTQEAALDALSAFVRDNVDLARHLAASTFAVEGKEEKRTIFGIIQKHLHDKRPNMRLIAVTCYTNFYRTGVVPERKNDICQFVLPVIVKLFQEQSMAIKEKAPLVLAYLVSDNEDLQRSSSEIDAIPKLAQLFTSSFQLMDGSKLGNESKNSSAARLCENSLIALASVSSMQEECRKAVIETKILPQIVKALDSSDVGVRVAACQTMRSLSRSVKNLRTTLIDAGLATPLFQLLSDKSTQVQTVASATLCNIVLDFSPMKKIVLENGGVEKLVSLASSMDLNLRLNAVWALKNLLFQADSEMKSNVLQKLGFQTLLALLDDPELQVQEQAMNLLRNVACRDQKDIALCFDGIGANTLLDIICKKLNSSSDEVILQTMYVLVNLSTGNETQKTLIMSSQDILLRILSLMNNPKPSIRVATIWAIINLTWVDEPVSDERIKILKELGFENKLFELVNDEDLDVRDRVRTALQHFQSHPTTSE